MMFSNRSGKGKTPMYQHRRPNFDPHDDTSKQWAKTGAWFLGPKGDNGETFKQFAMDAIDSHIHYRRSYYPCDPYYVTDDMRQSESYKETIKKTNDELKKMQDELQKAVPFFTSRYKGHVLWDTVMPANLGYITAMLFNQNNCASEASTVTTKFEIEVGIDLCKMVGFDPEKSMGHLVTGGSVANIEAMWAARNIKFYPLAVQDAIKNEDVLVKAKEYTLFLTHKNKELRIVDATNWDLLNIDVDAIVEMPEKVAAMSAVPLSELNEIISNYSYECIGAHEFCQRHKLRNNPCYLAPTTSHVSLFKGATIVGIGRNNLSMVPVDVNSRMDIKGLRDQLEDKLAKQIPVIGVIAIMGTTEESAVDPLAEILEIKHEMRARGLNFMIHADAAWGGYFCTMLRTPPNPLDNTNEKAKWFVPELSLGTYTGNQLSALLNVDTVTIDPHKTGFCPYPGGAICYRDKRINRFLNISNRAVYYHGSVNLGDIGIEGSKPGAAAAGIAMAHRIIGLHKNGYGRILGECMFTSKLLYCYWAALAEHDDPFDVVPTKPLPPDRSPVEHIKFIKRNIIGKTNDELAKNDEAMGYLREVGPDTMVPCFSINIKGNKDVKLVNDIVQAVFKDLCMSDDRVSAFRFPMLVTSSTYKHHDHSLALKEFKKRLGIDPFNTEGVKYIITTCMDPWATSIEFLDDLASIMRNAILCAIGTVLDPPAYHEFVASGRVDSNNQMVVSYLGRFASVPHQYYAVAKVEFINAADCKAAVDVAMGRQSPLVIRCVEKQKLHDVLLNEILKGSTKTPGVEVDCFAGIPLKHWVPFMRTKIKVVDVSRYDHLDVNPKRKYREKGTYFLYGDEDKAYITPVPSKQPSFQQMVELESVPEGLPKLLVDHGIEIEMPLDGSPKKEGLKILDPLDKDQYIVSYIGEGGKHLETTIKIGRKIFFDSEFTNSVPE